MGIRDFVQHLEEHRRKLEANPSADEREEMLLQAETMVGMADAAVKELESVIKNRRVNLPEEHALRFAQDVFIYLRDQEEQVKELLRTA